MNKFLRNIEPHYCDASEITPLSWCARENITWRKHATDESIDPLTHRSKISVNNSVVESRLPSRLSIFGQKYAGQSELLNLSHPRVVRFDWRKPQFLDQAPVNFSVSTLKSCARL